MSTRTGDDAATRYEKNQMVRRVLTRHSIDLELLSVSCMSSLVYLNGYLKKALGPTLKPAEVDIVFGEIEKIPWVRGIVADLEDMIVTNDEGKWLVTMKTPSRLTSTVVKGQPDHDIQSEIDIDTALKDLKKKNI